MGGKMNKKLNFFYVNFLSLNFEIVLIFSKLKEITKRFISGPSRNSFTKITLPMIFLLPHF